jgi:hypothetical protein
MILLIFLWTFSATAFIDGKEYSGQADTPPYEQYFQTYDECLSQLDSTLAMMDW